MFLGQSLFIEDYTFAGLLITVLAFVNSPQPVQISTTIGLLPNLKAILVYYCGTGTIPSQIGALSNSLNVIALFGNQLSGTVPKEIINLTKLNFMEIWSNGLSGTFPTEFGLLTSLSTMNLAVNKFSGTIPSQIAHCTLLRTLTVHQNKLSGTIPSEIALLGLMTQLILETNKLTSSIPSQLGLLSKLGRLDASNNFFNGKIPSELALAQLTTIILSENDFSGKIFSEFGIMTNLQKIYLDRNELSGTIPSEIFSFHNLTIVNFGSNKIIGSLPSELGYSSINLLFNISYNQMSGTIPKEAISNSDINILCDYSGLSSDQCAQSVVIDQSPDFVNPKIFIGVVCIVLLIMGFIGLVSISMFYYRKNEIVKATNYLFGIVSLAGLLILISSVIPFGLTLLDVDIETRNTSCAIYPQLLSHGLVIVLSSVVAQNYPIWKCFHNKNLKVLKNSSKKLIIGVTSAVCVSIALVTPMSVVLSANTKRSGCFPSSDSVYSFCLILIGIYIIFLAGVAGWMCFNIRNTPLKYNNTKDIAISTYNFMTFGLGMILIGLISTSSTSTFLGIFLSIAVPVTTFSLVVHFKKISEAMNLKKPLPSRPPRTFRSSPLFMPKVKITPDLTE
eukprot:c21978_g1_i5.p1 GENE.c21978_g1_i5~~c21978_g1_i5.p1  ORF type:complete len:618 (+),score=161.42 c21978_g1_i5:3-1856(+)